MTFDRRCESTLANMTRSRMTIGQAQGHLLSEPTAGEGGVRPSEATLNVVQGGFRAPASTLELAWIRATGLWCRAVGRMFRVRPYQD